MSDDWAWLYEVADDEWDAPPELSGPSSSPDQNLAILILSWPATPLEAVAELGRYLTACAEFTDWYVRHAKGSDRDIADVARLLARSSGPTRTVYEAWQRIQDVLAAEDDSGVIGRRMAVAKSNLTEAIRSATAELIRIRQSW